MTFNENTGSTISLEAAAKMTQQYRNSHQGEKQAAAFGKNRIASILEQPDCKGIRGYFAENENGETTLILVGVKETGDDIFDGQLMEFGAACPPICGGANPLNSDES